MEFIQSHLDAASEHYTCVTCQVNFPDSDLQKKHMRSDWHVYNMKRKAAGLESFLTREDFTQLQLVRDAQARDAERNSTRQSRLSCPVCQKSFQSDNSYQSHVVSAKHRQAVSIAARKQGGNSSVEGSVFSLGKPMTEGTAASVDGEDNEINEAAEVEDLDMDEDTREELANITRGINRTSLAHRPSPIKRPTILALDGNPMQNIDPRRASPNSPKLTLNNCVFCNYHSPTVELSVLHMHRIHGFLFPEREYLVDTKGLIAQLQRQVQEDRKCVYCLTEKRTPFAVQEHMKDTGHCKIAYTTVEEQLRIGDFYDFTSTYADEDDNAEDDEGGAKLGGAQILPEEEAWETDSGDDSDSSVDTISSAEIERREQATLRNSTYRTAVGLDSVEARRERLSKHPHHSHADPVRHQERDGYHSHAHKHARAAFHDGFELHLNGKRVGHRAYNRYYRQNLNSYASGGNGRSLALREPDIDQRRRAFDRGEAGPLRARTTEHADEDEEMEDIDDEDEPKTQLELRRDRRRQLRGGFVKAGALQKIRKTDVGSTSQTQRPVLKKLARGNDLWVDGSKRRDMYSSLKATVNPKVRKPVKL